VPDSVADLPKRFVYILRSVDSPVRRYIGLAADVPARLRAHNSGSNPSTAGWRPWAVDVCIEFRNEEIATRFEKYLKSGSGHEFAKRHF
jgi:predicted GIY-YIG superfamily endonuclease